MVGICPVFGLSLPCGYYYGAVISFLERYHLETSSNEPKNTDVGQVPVPLPDTAPPLPATTAGGISFAIAVVISIFISITTIGAGLIIYDLKFSQKVVCVDIKSFILDQQAGYVAGKINDEQLKANFDKMEKVIKSIPKNKAVVMGDAVIQGVPIIEIMPKIAAAPAPAAK